MNYFILEPDQTINQTIHLSVKKQDFISPKAIFLIADFKSAALPDFIQMNHLFASSFLLSDPLKELVSIYEESMRFYPVILTSSSGHEQKTYWRIEPEVADCFYQRDITQAAKVTLLSDQIPNHFLWIAKGTRLTVLVSSLSLAENMLRKNLRGIKYIPVPVLDVPDKENHK